MCIMCASCACASAGACASVVHVHVCVCVRVSVHGLEKRVCAHPCACAHCTQAVLISMLSGRLWSHDREGTPTAAMNHCIIEPPLDRAREGWKEGGEERRMNRGRWGGRKRT